MLFKTIDELRGFVGINNSISIHSIKPSIKAAELKYIIPLMDRVLYADLDTKYNNNALSTEETKLVEMIQQALAPYTIYLYSFIADGDLTDTGFRRSETDNKKTAFQYQGTNFRQQMLDDANLHTENLLQFLEDHLADYPAWTASEAFKKYRGLFIKTGTEFQANYPTASPWRNYYFFRPAMEDVEQLVLSKVLGTDLYTALKAREIVADPDYTDLEKQLLFRIRKFVAFGAAATALPESAVSLDERGLTVYTASGRATRDDDGKRGAADLKEKDVLIRQASQKADTWLNEIRSFLDTNASDTVFTEYYTWQKSLNTPVETVPYEPGCDNAGAYGIF